MVSILDYYQLSLFSLPCPQQWGIKCYSFIFFISLMSDTLEAVVKLQLTNTSFPLQMIELENNFKAFHVK
jgi:hypothetical protein